MKRARQQYELVTGIDVGSTAIRIAVGQYGVSQDGRPDMKILGLVEVPAEGVHKGIVTSIEEVVSSLSNSLEQIERLTGAPIEHAWVGISGTHILSQASKGVVAVAKSDGEISDEDVGRAVDAAKTVAVPLNYDILHVLPRTFGVDGQIGIKDPVGMTGIRLEVDVQIIYGVSAHIKNMTKAVYRTGIDIDDLVLSILATGDTVTTPRQKDLGVAVVDIGGSTTSIVVYEEGDIIHTAVIPLGSEHITNDIAIGLRTSIDVAERVKIEYGHCDPRQFKKSDKIQLSELGGSEEVIDRKYVSEIIQARAAEILEKVNEELVRVDRAGRLPAGVLYTGGGAKLSGLIELSKDVLELPATLGYPLFITSGHRNANDPAFTTAIGLVFWGSHMTRRPAKTLSRFNSSTNVMKKLQGIWKSLIP